MELLEEKLIHCLHIYAPTIAGLSWRLNPPSTFPGMPSSLRTCTAHPKASLLCSDPHLKAMYFHLRITPTSLHRENEWQLDRSSLPKHLPFLTPNFTHLFLMFMCLSNPPWYWAQKSVSFLLPVQLHWNGLSCEVLCSDSHMSYVSTKNNCACLSLGY